MKKINWLVAGILGFILLLFLFGGGVMSGWGYRGGYGMMGGPGMMGGWGFSPFGWLGMAFMWLIPIGVIALIVFGIAALTQDAGKTTPPSSQNSCSNCAKGIQSDWKNCPYCGTALK